MRMRAALAELASLGRVSRRAARAYGCSRARAAVRAREVRRAGAWTYDEALAYGMLDPAMPREDWERMYSQHRREAIQSRHNPLCLADFTEDKLTFHRYMAALGVPTPAVFGVVGRAGGWSAAEGRVARGPEAFARMLRDEVPDEIVIKPVTGYLGFGVHVLTRGPGGLRDEGDRPVDPQELHARLVSDPEFELFIVQERLRNHPEIEALHPTSALQTVRILTFVARDGTPEILCAYLKLALGATAVDNFRAGQTGNGEAMIDLEAGTLMPLVVPGPDEVGIAVHDCIPGTGRQVVGWRVPSFHEAREIVLGAAPHLLPMRTLGWDIAITPGGPVMLEVNNFWGSLLVPLEPEAHALFVSR